jgi:hypothetical protein
VSYGSKKKYLLLHIIKIKSFLVRLAKALFLTVILVPLTYSCKQEEGGHFTQGEIHYDVSYTGQVTRMPREIMPKNLIVSFKDDKIIYELISPIGNSGIINLANPAKEIYDTYLSLFSIKYFYPSKPGEIYPGFEAMRGIEIKKTTRSSIICGLKCKNAEVTFPFDRSKIYNVWYTEEIPVSNPNASTPFYQIDGVLMSFFFFIGRSEFHFEAQNVYKKEIPDRIFDRKEHYKMVSRKDINKFINKMVNL